MRRMARSMMTAAVTVWIGISTAWAHHSTGLFDGHAIVKISGTVAEFRWINPHASIVIEGGTAESSQGKWIVEMMAPTAMMDEGWRRDSLSIGDRVTVFAHPLRNPAEVNGITRVLYSGIVLPDHTILGQIRALRSPENLERPDQGTRARGSR
jgi:hypothetical protein